MNFSLCFLLVVIFGVGFSRPTVAKSAPTLQAICPDRVFLSGTKKIKFNKIETTFLCGDPGVEAWTFIPLAQVKFHLTTFLQDRGYFQPVFSEDGDTLTVNPGEQTRVSKVEVIGAPPFLDIRKRRQIVHRVLTPRILNEVEKWVSGRLKAQGYPCPVIKGEADIVSGLIRILVETGPEQKVLSITPESVPGLKDGVLRRFDAFGIGKPFNNDLLTLTAKRIEKNGLLQSTHFIAECKEDGAALKQKTIAGKPRVVNFGFGADTEQIVIVKGSWRHTRLGEKASSFEVGVFGSYKKQLLQISSSLYLFSPSSRWHLLPSITFEHDRESLFHFISGDARIAMASSWDNQKLGMQYSFGPDLNYVDTFRGVQTGLTRFLPFKYDFELASHYFEFYSQSPRTGFRLGLNGDFANKNLLSDVTIQRFLLAGEYLYNFRGYDPPLLVFGVRGAFGGAFVNNDPATLAKLPPNYRFYLGGSADLRGFGRQELPNADGALSIAFTSLELRVANFIPLGIQPFVFMDAGITGDQAFNFNLPVYYSPGFGVRYESPFGVFRTTLARGFKAGGNDGNPDNTHFQFFFSFGEEF